MLFSIFLRALTSATSVCSVLGTPPPAQNHHGESIKDSRNPMDNRQHRRVDLERLPALQYISLPTPTVTSTMNGYSPRVSSMSERSLSAPPIADYASRTILPAPSSARDPPIPEPFASYHDADGPWQQAVLEDMLRASEEL
ncbi:hypothetical protein DENSPDRAFT_844040 [Dentipellis sp. KUC8613]|nr:hypothetical protein DENSPDRAFT_844040 [Dentipellis sp. KUC8613]